MYLHVRVPWEEIIENKVELRRLDPFSKSLQYITICELTENASSMIGHFNFHNNPAMEEEFRRYINVLSNEEMPPRFIFDSYNDALKKEIAREKWFRHPCKSRIN